MNKTAIKRFAVHAKGLLISEIVQRAYELGISETEIKPLETFEGGFRVNGQLFQPHEIEQREELIEKMSEKGFEQVVEEVAYTWFNRIIALRYMEVNDYLPSEVRVLSSIKEGKVEPDIITEFANLDFQVDEQYIYELSDAQKLGDLYKYLFIKQCNALHSILPNMFEKINDYTELLLPNTLLHDDSIIRAIVQMIDEEDWLEKVEIIGWLYQYYHSDKKDEVFSLLKNNTKISKENVPAATQLFTPKWIVQYMVENSLGRHWLLHHPNKSLQEKWRYFRPISESTKEQELRPEQLKILDPCMGSGHILVYAFDVLYDMYVSCGYSSREIPSLILKNNLYGLDIDDRAAQLAYFAVMMKARSYDRRLFFEPRTLNIYAIQESSSIGEEALAYFLDEEHGSLNEEKKQNITHFFQLFKHGKEFGSILDVSEVNVEEIEARLTIIEKSESIDLLSSFYQNVLLEKLPPLIEQAKIMQMKYDVVVTNPPYMRRRNMNTSLNQYVTKRFLSPEDYFSVFIEKGFTYLKPNGYNAMVTTQSWMFLSTYERLREYLLSEKQLYCLLHMDTNVMISFATVAAVWGNGQTDAISDFQYVCQGDLKDEEPIVFPTKRKRNIQKGQEQFLHLPGKVYAYWCSEKLEQAFQTGVAISEKYDPKSGIKTGNNDRFLKFWHEVNFEEIGFQMKSYDDLVAHNFRWYPYNKGGGYRKWFGNTEHVVHLKDEAKMIRETVSKDVFRLRERNDYFRETITWPLTGADKFSSKYVQRGTLLDVASCGIYFDESIDYVLLGFLNSKVSNEILNMLNPTLSFPVNSISSLPLIDIDDKETVIELVKDCIHIAKEEWNSFEESWNYSLHPLLKMETRSLKKAFEKWSQHTEKTLKRLKQNEEKINDIFIRAYGLENELTNESVDLTYRTAHFEREMKSFISYAVGCMFGRYSLDEHGIVFAGGNFDETRYKMFSPTPTNVLPITDVEYFDDDIVNRFIAFTNACFGEETLEENLDTIALALHKKALETSREAIRRYFVKDFFKDHVQVTKKRPYYWLLDSGKGNGFKALVYMHRYDVRLFANARTEYVHPLQRKYEGELERLQTYQNTELSPGGRSKVKQRINTIEKQLVEIQTYDYVIAHVANRRISLDWEAGVKENYAMFQGIYVPEQKKRMNVLAELK